MLCRFCAVSLKVNNVINKVKSRGTHTELIGLFKDKYAKVKLRSVYADVKEFRERRETDNGEYSRK